MSKVSDAMRRFLAAQESTERDGYGLTAAIREGADLEIEIIRLDWLPRLSYQADVLGISVEEMTVLKLLLVEHRRMVAEEAMVRVMEQQAALGGTVQ